MKLRMFGKNPNYESSQLILKEKIQKEKRINFNQDNKSDVKLKSDFKLFSK